MHFWNPPIREPLELLVFRAFAYFWINIHYERIYLLSSFLGASNIFAIASKYLSSDLFLDMGRDAELKLKLLVKFVKLCSISPHSIPHENYSVDSTDLIPDGAAREIKFNSLN